jgi:hypothetical protein
MDAFSKLTRAGYVVATGRHYGSKSHYVLSARGARHVNDAIGSTVRLWLQPSEIRSKSLQHLLHTSAVNQFLISLELLCRHVSQVRVADVLHDIELKRQPVPVTLPDGTTHTVILDSWVELHIADTWQECLGVEVDRGFYEQKRWREKVRARVAFMKGPYQEYFKTTALRILVHAVPGSQRRYSLDNLVSWTEAELEALGEKHLAAMFCFTGQPLPATTPQALWLAPVWYVPFQPDPVSLLTKEESGP